MEPAHVFSAERRQADVEGTGRFLMCLSRSTRTLSPEARPSAPWPDACHVQMMGPGDRGSGRAEAIGTVRPLREGPGGHGVGCVAALPLFPSLNLEA